MPLYGISAAFWSIALKKLRNSLSTKYVPYLAMASAFSFLVQMFNIPVPGGTTGHAVGAAVAALVLGPWTAVVAMSIVLVIQALVFGDGGITALGANACNLAIVMPFVSYGVFRLLKGRKPGPRRVFVAAFLAGYVGICSAAILAGLEFGIQPMIAHSPQGVPLYAPYPIKVALPVMALQHLLFFGIIEGLITALLFAYIRKSEPDLPYALRAGAGMKVHL